MPRKETSSQTAVLTNSPDDDSLSVSSYRSSSSDSTGSNVSRQKHLASEKSHARTHSRTGGLLSAATSYFTGSSSPAPPVNVDNIDPKDGKTLVLDRETQRTSLRAYLRALLADPQIAKTKSIRQFLLDDPIVMNEAEEADEKQRKEVDAARVEDQKRFFQIAQKRARELDVYMESFRRDIIERSR